MRTLERRFADDWSDCERAMRAGSHQDIQDILKRFTSRMGFRNFGFASRRAESEGDAGYTNFHDFVGEWADSYRHLHTPHAEQNDPRILQARAWLPPVAWNSLGASSYALPSGIHLHAKRKLMLAGEFGLHSGITIPMRAPGIDWAFVTLTAPHRCSPREYAEILPSATYFAACLQVSLQRIEADVPHPGSPLSLRERECLRWSALGKTSWEISMIQSISERTVNFHLQRVSAKLGVKGRRAAVALALARGLITL
ncbi:MAG: autoinducer binding domain-containing protein [Xanthomonadaceae bacterium]|nr:autoinducer binding domain-containing protein [Xanthomonadaceae bacterium]